MSLTAITCPQCKADIPITTSLQDQLLAHARKDIEQEAQQKWERQLEEERASYAAKAAALTQQHAEQLQQAEERERTLRKKLDRIGKCIFPAPQVPVTQG
jgi:hypothetical protein